jgi:AraC-like DNA-binding protein
MLTYESHHFGKNNNFSHYHNYDFSFPKHLHRSFEFMHVKTGQIQVTINNRVFNVKENECILILPYEIHSFSTISPSDSYISVFSPEYVKVFHNMIYEKVLDNPVFVLSSNVKSLIIDNVFKHNDNLLEMKACFYLICSETIKNSNILDNIKTDYELLQKTLNYIQENFTDNISLKIISSKLGYSYTYLSKYLNKMLGISFVDFVNENRINYALYLLKNTELTITDIAYECGYSNIRSFNRNFVKITNTTPKVYRNS